MYGCNTQAILDIRMLGDFRISINGASLPDFPTREAELLFSYLLLNRNRVFHREALIEKFFNDQQNANARKRLRNDIWRIRSVLEPEGVPSGTYLTVTNRDIGFNSDSLYRLDVQEFESAVKRTSSVTEAPLCDDEYDLLSDGLDLYRGDLLEGNYDDWCIWEKERLKLMYLHGFERLMNHHAAKKEWNEAATFAQLLITHDPLRECVHRSLMRFYYMNGDRPSALVQYKACEELLRDELSIEPMRDTVELYEAIKSESMFDTNRRVNGIKLDDDVSSVNKCIGDIHQLAEQLNTLSNKLKQRIQLVDQIEKRMKF